MAGLHEVEGHEETTSGTRVGGDGEKDDGAGDVDDDVRDHDVDRLAESTVEEAERSSARSGEKRPEDVRGQEVKADLEQIKRDADKQRGEHLVSHISIHRAADSGCTYAEAKCLVDQKRVEGVEATDNGRLRQVHHEQKPGKSAASYQR